jgi:hypothetical protein
MAGSGFPTAGGRRRFSNFALIFFLAAYAIAGCTVKYGQIPAIEKLESSVTPLEATKGEILQVLGPPRGYGIARLPGRDHKKQTLWFYEYARASGMTGKIDLVMLLVFFDEDQYVNHLWFSSLEKVEKKKK